MAKHDKIGPVEYDARTIFCYAEAFSKAVELLAPQFKRAAHPVHRNVIARGVGVHVSELADSVPFEMVDSFALELYLKCLHMMDHGVPAWGHDIRALYNGLKPHTRRRLRHNYDAEVARSPLTSTMRKSVRKRFVSFRAYLNASNIVFNQVRYLFERKSRGAKRMAYWPLLRFAARKSVLDIMPEWP